MFTILNRWRGGALPFYFPGGGAKFVSFVLLIIFYLLTKDIIVSLLISLGYLFGESWGWGKWIGSICFDIPKYDEDEGKQNGIHFIANLFFPERKDWKKYTLFALFLRGILWWTPVIVFIPNLTILEKTIIILFLGIGFPTSTLLGRWFYNTYRKCYNFACSCWGWEEIFYGVFQDIAFIYIFLKLIYG